MGTGEYYFPCSADHEQDWQPYPVEPYSAICDEHTYILSEATPHFWSVVVVFVMKLYKEQYQDISEITSQELRRATLPCLTVQENYGLFCFLGTEDRRVDADRSSVILLR